MISHMISYVASCHTAGVLSWARDTFCSNKELNVAFITFPNNNKQLSQSKMLLCILLNRDFYIIRLKLCNIFSITILHLQAIGRGFSEIESTLKLMIK
jgi:hypothetical protein